MTKTQIQEIHNTLLDIMASGLIEENEEVRKAYFYNLSLVVMDTMEENGVDLQNEEVAQLLGTKIHNYIVEQAGVQAY